MDLEANKSIARRFIEELWNGRHLDVADEIFSADCVTHQLRSGGDLTMARGPEALKRHVADWLAAFPDIRFTIGQMIAEGDRVMTQCTARGTHTGAWLGVAPTGSVITIQMAVIQRVAGAASWKTGC